MLDSERCPDNIPGTSTVEVDIPDLIESSQFDIRERIGSSAKSTVYQKTVSSGVSIAVKFPDRSTVRPEDIAGIFDEAEKWEMFDDDDHVVSLLGYGTTETNHPWIAMEYMDGGDLGTRIERETIESLQQGLWYAYCIASGIDAAHDIGVAHRDLKPQNVLFCETASGEWDVPKVGDWGTATPLLASGQTVGEYTPSYAAPEQHTQNIKPTLQKRIDVYQLGVLIYELVAGRHPFGHSTEQALQTDPDPPSEIRPGIPHEIDTLVLNCLERDPSDRPRDARPITDTLSDMLDQLSH
jgi:serine/threonine protein kinase